MNHVRNNHNIKRIFYQDLMRKTKSKTIRREERKRRKRRKSF